MPRWHRTAAVNYKRIPAILGTTRRDVLPDFIQKNTPKLYNAKRRIKYSHGLTGEQYKQWLLSPADIDPFEHISDDVADYIRNNGLEGQLRRHAPQDEQEQTDEFDDEASRLQPRSETLAKLLRNPPQFFSRPYNVPETQRTQVHFPNFEVAMIRRPKHPPNYATFQVPLWFNKMDMKDYLKSLYDVDVVDVRSFVYQLSKRKQEKDLKRIRKRKLYRPMPLKRMTVQLVDAFEWPKEPEDFSELLAHHESLHDVSTQNSKKLPRNIMDVANTELRHKLSQQARDVVLGKQKWKPTWTQLDSDKKVMQGIADVVPRIPVIKEPKGRRRAARELVPLPDRTKLGGGGKGVDLASLPPAESPSQGKNLNA
ncbi:54S ribosomal protein L23, mitochondrial [Cyphellophora attinorum]|uniref:Large ribosomal subunit protein uL23m n=1 Tax=Cyphellophora attinorum TaxID=1664694 RepID=A0A0N1H537_9EURO|nr:54S ribosomal protein L23, mitochondrial [Phialophora attinorum]KPI36004.1 54S ribosomal protein L23, mitochondrial [Phialophora attinorum]